MPLQGEYEPGTLEWARKQADLIESSGGTEGTEMNGMRVIVVTSVGNKSGKLRKSPLMRVEHEGRYAAVASPAGRRSTPSGTTTSSPTRTSRCRTAHSSRT